MWVGVQIPTSILTRLITSTPCSCVLNSSNTLAKTSWLKLFIRQQGTLSNKTTNGESILRLSPARGWGTRCDTRSMAMSKTKSKQLAKETVKGGKGQLTVGEKVARAGKDTMYIGIVIVGIGVTGLMFATVFKELFSSKSPNGVYTKALKRCLQDYEIVEELGEPIKGYGEETRRRRRRHVNHFEYEKDGVRHMRMKFYMKGSKRRATVNLEVKEDENGKYDYRYMFAELDGYPQKTIILEDNR